MEKKLIKGIFTLLLLFCSHVAVAQTWYIGILAPRGVAVSQQQWQPWVDWLSAQWPDQQFVMVPLSLKNMQQSIDEKKIDFILSQQAQLLSFTAQTPVRWIATQSTVNDEQWESSAQIGSALWVLTESSIHTLEELKNTRISAVAEDAFGGYLLIYKLLLNNHLKQGRDYEVLFTGYPVDQTLKALQERKVDAAIAPLCLLEEMQKTGQLNLTDFRLIHPVDNNSQCLGSTDLFPNWTLAALPSVPIELVVAMSTELLKMAEPTLPRWAPPLAPTQVEAVLLSINRHPWQQNVWSGIRDWTVDNKWLVLAVFSGVLLFLMSYAWLSFLAHRRKQELGQAFQQMRSYEQAFTKADRLNLLGEMASGIGHEINQPLSVIRHYAEGSLLKLKRNDPEHELIPILHKITEQIELCHQSISNLRLWAKPEEEIKFQQIVLHDVVARTIQYIHLEKIHNACKIDNQIDPAVSLYSASSMIEQILLNCLLNAIQQGAKAITVKSVIDHRSQRMRLSICDDAGGFSEEHLRFPFVPFRSSKESGLGLGLVICQRLAQSLQGELLLENRCDAVAGACITLSLPLKKEE